MNLGLSELGVLGIIVLLFFGGALKMGSKKKSTPASPHSESNPQADYQNTNIDYNNTPITNAPPPKAN